MRSRSKYLARWRRNNRHSEWLHQREFHARKLERKGNGRVTILGVRVNWKAAAQ